MVAWSVTTHALRSPIGREGPMGMLNPEGERLSPVRGG